MKLMKNLSLAGLISVALVPTAFAAEAGTPWYLDATIWTFGTLVIFLLAIWKIGAFKAVGGMLDSRAKTIEDELAYAQSLREEAADMLKEAERRQKEASDTVDAIIKQAEADAKLLMAQADKDIAEMVARREAQVEQRIARAEAEATAAVKQVAADAATKAAGDIVRAAADKNDGADAFKAAVSQAKALI